MKLNIKLCIFILLSSFKQNYCYNLCVVGGKSGLGRELVYQSILSNQKVLALTNNSLNIEYPHRGTGLTRESSNKYIESKNLKVDSYDNFKKYKVKNIVFTTGAGPFELDYSDIITENIIENIDYKLEQIILISAHGVGNSLEKSNLGIKIMDSIYLRDSYRAKNAQEKIIKDYSEKKNVNSFIIRPKGLSFGPNLYSIQSREKLASEILELLFLN